MIEHFVFLPEGVNSRCSVISFDPEGSDYRDLLRFLRAKLGCDLIECVRVRLGLLLVDESGLFKPVLRVNARASILYGHSIVGNAIFCSEGYRDGEPDLVGFPDPDVAQSYCDKFNGMFS